MMKVIELTKENEKQYLEQIVDLEQIALDAMKKEGREGQLFATGKEDISEYVHSDENTVLVATNEQGEVQATAYVTQGQIPFTYNDLTKYFKHGEKYEEYVKSQFTSEEEYQKTMLRMYAIKIKAFEYAKSRILVEYPHFQDIKSFLQQEIEANGFHEKSQLREKFNRYMSVYIMQNFGPEIQKRYEQFYWLTLDDIECTGRQCNSNIPEVSEYESILNQQNMTIYEEPEFEESKYYSANTSNSVELDTYITLPSSRAVGTARIVVFEGIRKHIESHFKNPRNTEIFLCSTLHRDNLPSKYVSEFFGLTDSLYVNRRQGINREVHICRIGREQAMDYLTEMSDKLVVLYGYNPNQKAISQSTRLKILKEQLGYEKAEFDRLQKARATNKKFSGVNLRFIEGKTQKIKRLEQEIREIEEENRGEQ